MGIWCRIPGSNHKELQRTKVNKLVTATFQKFPIQRVNLESKKILVPSFRGNSPVYQLNKAGTPLACSCR